MLYEGRAARYGIRFLLIIFLTDENNVNVKTKEGFAICMKF